MLPANWNQYLLFDDNRLGLVVEHFVAECLLLCFHYQLLYIIVTWTLIDGYSDFSDEYVICIGCKSPDTILSKENRLFFLRCEKVTV